MSASGELRGAFRPRIADIDRAAWNACFADEAEDHAYYCACQCEESSAGGQCIGAVTASRSGDLLAVAPVFTTRFTLDTSFQESSGWLGTLRRRLAGLIGWPLLGLGSPFAERCHIGLRPGLNPEERAAALAALIDSLEERARREGMPLMAVKDVADSVTTHRASGMHEGGGRHAASDMHQTSGSHAAEVERVLTGRGYVRLTGLPVAVLDLAGLSGIEGYLARLSAPTRKDIRRKLRAAGGVRVQDTHDIRELAPQIAALYEETRAGSGLDYGEFERLPAEYFSRVSAELGERALFRLYWVGETLAAFNLLLLERERIIDKFLGMRYPLARGHNLYALSWIENVRLCLARGVRWLQTGQTAYHEKLRLGSHLEPSAIYFRHRAAVANGVLRACAPLASFERNDPDLGRRAARRHA